MIPLFKPYMPDVPEIDNILHSGALSYGEYSKQFEEKLREYFGVPYLMVTSSFQMAISVILASLGLKSDDEVIASPMACLASTQPYLSCGLKIRWADVDPQIGTLAPDSVEKRISKKTKVIVHNHFCGYPGHIDAINKIGKKYNIPVIDDGIECFGSEYHGMKIGNCGTDITVFALTAVRFCNCIDGGVIIFKDKGLYEKSLLIRDCGIDRSIFRDKEGEIDPKCDINLLGYNATMNNLNGYIGLKQMDVIEELIEAHRQQAERWTYYFKDKHCYRPISRPTCRPNYWVYGILVSNKRETIKLFRTKNYYASSVHIRNDIYSVFGDQEELPGVEQFNESFLALPCGWWME